MSNVFEAIANAEVSFGGFYLEPGVYTVEVQRAFLKQGRNKDEFFIVEMTVIESNNPERPPGCSPSWVVKMSQDAAAGNVKAFMLAVSGVHPNDKEAVAESGFCADTVKEYTSEDNPLHGARVNVEVQIVKTKRDTDFSKHFWSPTE